MQNLVEILTAFPEPQRSRAQAVLDELTPLNVADRARYDDAVIAFYISGVYNHLHFAASDLAKLARKDPHKYVGGVIVVHSGVRSGDLITLTGAERKYYGVLLINHGFLWYDGARETPLSLENINDEKRGDETVNVYRIAHHDSPVHNTHIHRQITSFI